MNNSELINEIRSTSEKGEKSKELLKLILTTKGKDELLKYLINSLDYEGILNNYLCDFCDINKCFKPEKINTIEDLAKLLNGNEYRDELYNEYGINVCDICKQKKWVIVFGASDDLIEFEGFIYDEDGAWDGTLCKLVKPGDFYLEDEDDETYKKAKDYKFVRINKDELNEIKNKDYKDTCIIEMQWDPEEIDASWQVNVKGAPFVKFNVMEDEELYCEAAIIDLNKFIKDE